MCALLNIPISPTDRVSVEVAACGSTDTAVTVHVCVLFLLASGVVQQSRETVTIVPGGLGSTDVVPAAYGTLLSVSAELDDDSIYVVSGAGLNAVGVLAHLVRGSVNDSTAWRLLLLDGLIVGNSGVSSDAARRLEQGRRLALPDPAAGASFSFGVGDGNLAKIGLLSWLYTASAAVATRTPRVTISGDNLAGTSVYTYISQQTIAALGEVQYQLAIGLNRYSVAGNLDCDALPDAYIQDALITISAASMQAGDQISDVNLCLVDNPNSFF